jgi:signal transduction histidine kinase
VADLSSDPELPVTSMRRFGPALYAPLVAGEERMGVLVLLRLVGDRPFTDDDLATAGRFAGQAALALQLAEARRRAEDAELLEERQRIARDLHDLVVQELFSMGMRLSRLRGGIPAEAQAGIDSSLEALDRVVRQIRTTIRAMRDPEEATGLADRIHAEVARARASLGFGPDLELDLASGDAGRDVASPDVADDVVAVVREGLSNAARHARSGHVLVRVRATRAWLQVVVEDDGVGLSDGPRRSGLENLTARARRHGGECWTTARTPQGTRLCWQVPLAPPA